MNRRDFVIAVVAPPRTRRLGRAACSRGAEDGEGLRNRLSPSGNFAGSGALAFYTEARTRRSWLFGRSERQVRGAFRRRQIERLPRLATGSRR